MESDAPIELGPGVAGKGFFATKNIKKGDVVIFEPPLAVARDPVEGAPSDTMEWNLTYQLLQQGMREEWSQDYVKMIPGEVLASDATEECVAWLREALSVSAEDVLGCYGAVLNNAFSLETFALKVNYGAAFYSRSSYFNHSCAPNCLSLRMGGNMAVFATEAIARGEELTHSYIPDFLLLTPTAVRNKHLHFECKCARCLSAGGDSVAQRMSFPSAHESTDAGASIGAFKVAAVIGGEDEIVAAGDRMLRESGGELQRYPVSALETLAPYLQAHWACAAVQGQGSPAVGAAYAARIWSDAVERIEESQTFPPNLLRQLRCTSAVLRFVLHAGLREETSGELLARLTDAAEMYGSSRIGLACLREDTACLSDSTCTPTLSQLIDEGPTAAVLSSLEHDVCALPSCHLQESSSVKFLRCSRCKRVKYCGKEHQKRAWKQMHKYACGGGK